MPVVRAHPLTDADGSTAADGRRASVLWSCFSDDPADTAHQVLASALLPADGEVSKRYVRGAGGLYVGTADGSGATVVDRSARRDPEVPGRWLVTVQYAGGAAAGDQVADVEFASVPYQAQQACDVYGAVYTNSALEPYEDGATVDRHRLQLVISKTVDYGAYDAVYHGGFQNTRNKSPLRLGGMLKQVPKRDAGGAVIPGEFTTVPQEVPAGWAKLTDLSGPRRVRTPGTNTTRVYEFRLRAVVDIDLSTFVGPHGLELPTMWQDVRADAGYSERVDGKLRRIRTANAAATGPSLLDGAGRRLFQFPPTAGALDTNPPELAVVDDTGDGRPVPAHQWYVTRARGSAWALDVPAPGVLLNCFYAGGGPVTAAVADAPHHGTATVASDGAFKYKPTAGYVGWDSFTFTASAGGLSSTATVAVLVGLSPRVRTGVRYPLRDWAPLDFILGGW